MKPIQRCIALQSGQALALASQGSAQLFVIEGEVLLQPAAQWLGETVVVAPARRVAAPAEVACDGMLSLTALGTAKVRFGEAVSLGDKLRSAWNALGLPQAQPKGMTRRQGSRASAT